MGRGDEYHKSSKGDKTLVTPNSHLAIRRKIKEGAARFPATGSFDMRATMTVYTDVEDLQYRIKNTLGNQHGYMFKIISCTTTTYSSIEKAEFIIKIYYGSIHPLHKLIGSTIVIQAIHPDERDITIRMIPCA